MHRQSSSTSTTIDTTTDMAIDTTIDTHEDDENWGKCFICLSPLLLLGSEIDRTELICSSPDCGARFDESNED